MTAYNYNGIGEDPNRNLIFCHECAKMYVEYWKSMWDDYYASVNPFQ